MAESNRIARQGIAGDRAESASCRRRPIRCGASATMKRSCRKTPPSAINWPSSRLSTIRISEIATRSRRGATSPPIAGRRRRGASDTSRPGIQLRGPMRLHQRHHHRRPLPHRHLAQPPAPRRVPLRPLVRLSLLRQPPVASPSMWCGPPLRATYRAAAPMSPSSIGQ
jgi:hypothetical protein